MTTYKLKVKNLFVAIAALSAFFLSSCENEFDASGDWKDITVIYGLLDPEGEPNWVRVQRAYLGPDAASISFNNPDSLYYDSIEVSIQTYENVNGTPGNKYGDPIKLVKDYSHQMEEGTFTTEGFRLYRTTDADKGKIFFDRDQDYIYQIIVKKPGTNNPDASSYTNLVGGSSDGFKFIAPNPNISTARLFNGRLEWYSSANAKIYEIDMYVNYTELNRNYSFYQDSTIKIDYGSLEGVSADVEPSTKIDFTQRLSVFYSELEKNFPPIQSGHFRFINSLTFVIWAGGEDLAKYINLNKPTLGVNSNRPEFPDIENGVGVFSSRTSIRLNRVELDPSLEDKYYLSAQLCGKGFAVVNSGDTCYCQRRDGLLEQVCF